MAPLPMAIWCARCHASAHSSKDIMDGRCAAAGWNSTALLHHVRARNWQKKTQLWTWANAEPEAREGL
eukprot:8731947-Alexandrium_andersonii.AAC.1